VPEPRSRGRPRGWRALIGEEDDGELMVAVFCPDCATREFGLKIAASWDKVADLLGRGLVSTRTIRADF
jgi:hypothetical protein